MLTIRLMKFLIFYLVQPIYITVKMEYFLRANSMKEGMKMNSF